MGRPEPVHWLLRHPVADAESRAAAALPVGDEAAAGVSEAPVAHGDGGSGAFRHISAD